MKMTKVIRGIAKDAEDRGLENLWVVAYDTKFFIDKPLGKGITNVNGEFSITYPRYEYGVEREPNVRIKVFSQIGRLLSEQKEVFPNVSQQIFTLPDPIIIDSRNLNGWLVTLLTGSPTLLSKKNHVKPLIDNKICWEELANSIIKSEEFIHSAQLYIDVDENILIFDPPNPEEGQPAKGISFEEGLIDASNENVAVKLIVNDFKGLPYPVDTYGKVEKYFEENQPNNVKLAKFRMPYNRAMHAKFTVVDSEIGILNASPLLQEYFDDTSHSYRNPRRGSMSWLENPVNYFKNAIKIPVHDVSLSIQGEAVKSLNETFDLLWRNAGETGVSDPPCVLPKKNNASVQIVRTLPGNRFTEPPGEVPDGELGILEAYLRAIENAEDFIYFENQYFTERIIAGALLEALRIKPELQIILLINNVVDIPEYQVLQTNLIKFFLEKVEEINACDRVGIFTRWTYEPETNKIVRNYVHSKVGIVDNKWTTIGSANLDGVSLYVSQHILFFYSRLDYLEERAVELNAIIYNNVDGLPRSSVPDDLRRTLWAEHLGYSDINHPDLKNKPSAGWVSLWKTYANEKNKNLNNNPPAGHQANILQWNEATDPEDYLKALGVNEDSLDKLSIEKSVENFYFSTGEWGYSST